MSEAIKRGNVDHIECPNCTDAIPSDTVGGVLLLLFCDYAFELSCPDCRVYYVHISYVLGVLSPSMLSEGIIMLSQFISVLNFALM